MKKKKINLLAICVVLTLFSCNQENNETNKEVTQLVVLESTEILNNKFLITQLKNRLEKKPVLSQLLI